MAKAAKKDPALSEAVDEEKKLRVVRSVGDNESEKPVDGKKLMGFIKNIERLNSKKDQVLQEIREVYADCKAVGYDNRTIRTIVRERTMEEEKRKEQQDLMDLYKSAIGMLDD